jgi:hypothetical protein
MRNDYDSVWTVISSSQKGLEVAAYLREDYATPQDFAIKGATILKVDRLEGSGFIGLCPLNCVEIAKAALGINKPFLFTPHQLYRWLYGLGNSSSGGNSRRKR